MKNKHRQFACRALILATAAASTSIFLGCGGGSGGSGTTSNTQASTPAVDTNAPKSLQVPTLAFDDTSITLVWKKPDNYANVVDYRVYQDGKLLGTANANNTQFSPAKPYIDQFYADDTAGFHVKVQAHSYLVTGLKPDTRYSFTVRAVYSNGSESGDSAAITAKTASAFINITDISKIATAGETSDATITAANTTAIQTAIDSCAASSTSAYGCKVLVPAGVYMTGALFLKSNMTLEIAAGAALKASPNTADFPIAKGYQLYSYNSSGASVDDRRAPSLLNLLTADHLNGSVVGLRAGYDDTREAFTNVLVVGKGRLDGNGWIRSSTDLVSEAGASLAQFKNSSSSTWNTQGVLVKNQVAAGVAETPAMNAADAYSYRRSSLTTFRGVKNIYVGELTLTNPGNHGVMFLESQNIVMAGTSSQTFDVNNGDGVEFGNSDNMMAFNNFFDTGDDNVNFAAGQGADYEGANPSQNGWIFNNYMREGHGMLALGSHTAAWIQDILCEDNVAYLTDNGLRLKTNPYNGGGARRITFRDNAMRSVGAQGNTSIAGGKSFTDAGNNGQAFIFTVGYSATSNTVNFDKSAKPAQFLDITVRNVSLDNISTAKGNEAIHMDSYDGKSSDMTYAETFHTGFVFDNVRIKDAKPTSIARMKNSTFSNFSVTLSGATAPASWWVFSATNPGISFDTKTVTPSPSPLPQ
ncbi:glycoside hydrolase family 28 protein [Uliginosibacterium sp. 31-16]|uniref:glycoside hydrolase family 28 protein n=1 Tax=Uliginosibacterium sp. 31-16 TaxID=3068315 RepID=UPI00273FE242|nr:glycoside hydrolase family 28 protein [Uliginosibacterium sp. 31-16]MDP5239660.1 glycoside hydrolase family 28 protein [Uliginosibacterium sp. 31-16]